MIRLHKLGLCQVLEARDVRPIARKERRFQGFRIKLDVAAPLRKSSQNATERSGDGPSASASVVFRSRMRCFVRREPVGESKLGKGPVPLSSFCNPEHLPCIPCNFAMISIKVLLESVSSTPLHGSRACWLASSTQ